VKTPFFPALRPWLAPLGRRVQPLRQQSLSELELLLQPLVPPGLLAQADQGPNSRERIFSVRRTVFGFLYQILNPDCPCREVVRQIQALFTLHDRRDVHAGTSAYCQARKRLPLTLLKGLRAAIAKTGSPGVDLWHGLHPKVMDATTVSLPDMPENQAAYPQSGSQKPGCGFPMMKLVESFSLSTGMLLDYVKGNKHDHDLRLWRRLLGQFRSGDLVMADRGFCSYVLIALLLGRRTQSLLRLHHSRPADMRQGKRLGKKDRLLIWSKPNQSPAGSQSLVEEASSPTDAPGSAL
jgi:hypothetical protein